MKPFYIYSLVVLALGNAANACMNGLGDHQRVSKGSVSIKPWFTTDNIILRKGIQTLVKVPKPGKVLFYIYLC